MKLGQAGRDLMHSFEKCVLRVYDDGYGFPTIGWGHLVKPGEKFPETITQQRADEIFAADVAWAEQAVNDALTVTVNQNQFDALVSLCFNIGAGNFKGSTLVKLVNRGDFAGAANEFGKWRKSAGQVSKGLIRRREAEKKLFQS